MLLTSSIYFTAAKYVRKLTKYGLKTKNKKENSMKLNKSENNPSSAYIMATWVTLAIGVGSYLIGIWNSNFQLNEQGFYLAVFLLSMFSAVTLQKTVRDKEEGLPVTNVFIGMCWFSFAAGVALLALGLINANILLSEKGFFGISFLMSLFTMITVQKNIRDMTDENGQVSEDAFPKSAKNLKDGISDAIDLS